AIRGSQSRVTKTCISRVTLSLTTAKPGSPTLTITRVLLVSLVGVNSLMTTTTAHQTTRSGNNQAGTKTPTSRGRSSGTPIKATSCTRTITPPTMLGSQERQEANGSHTHQTVMR